jgi:hypothetical protein
MKGWKERDEAQKKRNAAQVDRYHKALALWEKAKEEAKVKGIHCFGQAKPKRGKLESQEPKPKLSAVAEEESEDDNKEAAPSDNDN